MKEQWVVYRSECCDREFAVKQPSGDELEEPGCPECGGTNCELIGEAEVKIKGIAPIRRDKR
ncbi:hypothetical protein [Paenibacillus sp. FSL L8-0463]|uniref:hypothetical protein n=1 Tax=Paenibacillus sp. FSL L8-0463 TaxID=2954687 RepID=UPI003119699A